jgi:hypothetical protein
VAAPLLFDVHVHNWAGERLRDEGIDVVYVSDVGLAGAGHLSLLLAAAEAGRIVVTRNYQDFAPLARALGDTGESFPGVLFLSPAIPQSDLSGHVRAVRRWCRDAGDANPVEGSIGWIEA